MLSVIIAYLQWMQEWKNNYFYTRISGTRSSTNVLRTDLWVEVMILY